MLSSDTSVNRVPFQGLNTLYQGSETVKERGFEVGDKVYVGANYCESFGTIVRLNEEFPFKAEVRLDHESGSYTICWIKSEEMLIYSKQKDLASRIDSNWVRIFGSLYQGDETIEERGFKVGDKVYVGADYSEKYGTIIKLSKDIPYKAEVRLDHRSGSYSTCWIKSEHLLKMK